MWEFHLVQMEEYFLLRLDDSVSSYSTTENRPSLEKGISMWLSAFRLREIHVFLFKCKFSFFSIYQLQVSEFYSSTIVDWNLHLYQTWSTKTQVLYFILNCWMWDTLSLIEFSEWSNSWAKLLCGLGIHNIVTHVCLVNPLFSAALTSRYNSL